MCFWQLICNSKKEAVRWTLEVVRKQELCFCVLEAFTSLPVGSPGANLYLAHASRCCLVTEG